MSAIRASTPVPTPPLAGSAATVVGAGGLTAADFLAAFGLAAVTLAALTAAALGAAFLAVDGCAGAGGEGGVST